MNENLKELISYLESKNINCEDCLSGEILNFCLRYNLEYIDMYRAYSDYNLNKRSFSAEHLPKVENL